MIFVECKPDFYLVRLYKKNRDIVHAGNKSEVIKRTLKKQNSTDVIDADPGSAVSSFLKKFTKIEENLDAGISVLKADNNSRLIVLYPRLEQWILEAAKEAQVDVKKFGLPNDEVALHEVININLEKYQDLLEVLQKKRIVDFLNLQKNKRIKYWFNCYCWDSTFLCEIQLFLNETI